MTDTTAIGAGSTVVVPPSTTAQVGAGQTSGAGRLGKQDFLNLLTAQLRNQDPTKPMDDSQMIAQMAQFSALEAMQALNLSVQRAANMQAVTQAAALVGRYVQAAMADGTAIDGPVSAVSFQTADGQVQPLLTVNDRAVNLSDVRSVLPAPTSSQP